MKFLKDNKEIIFWLIGLFLVWRLSLIFLAWLGESFVPLRTDYLGGGLKTFLKEPLVWAWANFDGVHYLSIAKRGYLIFQQAFFPFYPLFIRQLGLFLGSDLFSGLLISHVFLLVALFLFYKLIRLDFSQEIGKRSLVYLLLFPTSFYLGSVYSESLFLALVLGAFLAARKKCWWLAGILGAISSATRLVGIFLFPALLLEWYQQKNKGKSSKQKGKEALPLFLIILGLLVYMWYLNKTVSDPLYFIHVQPYFGAQRSGGKLIMLYQVFWRYLKMLLTVEKFTPTYFTVILESLTGGLFLILTLFTYLKKRLSYFVFMALAFLAPTLSGTLSSMPRYALVLFPGFILLAVWAEEHPWLRRLYPLLTLPFLALSVILFTRGYFVA